MRIKTLPPLPPLPSTPHPVYFHLAGGGAFFRAGCQKGTEQAGRTSSSLLPTSRGGKAGRERLSPSFSNRVYRYISRSSTSLVWHGGQEGREKTWRGLERKMGTTAVAHSHSQATCGNPCASTHNVTADRRSQSPPSLPPLLASRRRCEKGKKEGPHLLGFPPLPAPPFSHSSFLPAHRSLPQEGGRERGILLLLLSLPYPSV